MELLTPQHWKDYELIDSGQFEKLERFGPYITIRPEPQALWDKGLSNIEWKRLAHVSFVSRSSSSGVWNKHKQMPDQWSIQYHNLSLQFRLGLTAFKHLGIFPEQSENWEYIYNCVKQMKTPKPKVLNLFAYTGGASLAANMAGAETYHLDSVKQVVTWSRENMELSGQKDIRWIVEDALTFVKREVKRGKRYNGIILDPPAFGQGVNGERWKLEDNINEMMKLVKALLDEEECFLVLNTYSLGFSSLIIENLLLADVSSDQLKTGELYLSSQTKQKLPLGVFGRYFKQHKS